MPAINATPIAMTLLTIRSRSSSMCSRSVISSNTSGSLGSGSRGREGNLAGSLPGIFSLGGLSARAMRDHLPSVRADAGRLRLGDWFERVWRHREPRQPGSAAIRSPPRSALAAVLVDVLHSIRDRADILGILV